MKVKLNLFYPALREFINSPAEIMVSGLTVGECLRDFTRQFPGAERWIFDHRGQLVEQVVVFINAESSRRITLSDPVREGDELILAMLVIGG